GEGGGYACGAATVACRAEGHEPCGDGGRRPTARAAGGPRQVPRVARCAPRLRMGEGGDAELGRGRLADGDGTRGAQAADVRRVLVDWPAALVEKRALRCRHARAVLEVFDAEGHSGERSGVVTP